MKSLLLGCGNNRQKKIWMGEENKNWSGDLVTVDMNPDCKPDLIWDLDKHPLPFPDETFDEIGMYDVLEHLGRQGDWRGFFDEFADYWRLLKPGGVFGIIVPINADSLSDPGHTRFFSKTQFGFLNQNFYRDNLEKGTQVTDYRWFWKKSFDILHNEAIETHHIGVILKKA